MKPFTSLRDYERFIYTVRLLFPSVKSSDLVVIPRGRRTAVLRGELIFESGVPSGSSGTALLGQ
ncbi:MAG: hypothetical protein B6245_20895 [Desulfobacteraceae bacterium 4572_88]|nr:MAG: hypothetical protein B6245_20895 [Desulfobacteraceae bacterium 4572_88]